MRFSPGMLVRARNNEFRVVESFESGETRNGQQIQVLRLEDIEKQNFQLQVLYPLESVEHFDVPKPSLLHPGRLAFFRLFYQALLLESSGVGQDALAPHLARVRREEYQFTPVKMVLALPRPRMLIADDVGLGKTIEAGLILMELHLRRRANRVLIVCPASLTRQWQQQMAVKFGFPFVIFDRENLAEKRREVEAGVNPWAYEPRIIASMDFLKRPDGVFRELQGLRWDVVIMDEAHHLSTAGTDETDKQLTRLGYFLAEASDGLLFLTATPHNGYDESMRSLLWMLDPTLALPDKPLDPKRYRLHFIRRLKKHIRNCDGTPKFVERELIQPLEVELSDIEKVLHKRIRQYAKRIREAAERERGNLRHAFQFVATVLSKRAASSQAALRSTLERRLTLLQERLEDAETDRDMLKRWRRGEPMTPNEQRKLENDAYASYISAMRRLRLKQNELEDERNEVQELLGLLRQCEEGGPDPKLRRILNWLQALHKRSPEAKVLIFTEYVDTVDAIAGFLRKNGYEGKVVTATGDDTRRDRHDDEETDRWESIKQFLFGDHLILVATDIAGEGLDLHYTCNHLIHFELPWNPNRMEQRNGRIDRYGQTKPPVIGFLYLSQSYEDEILRRLLEKLDQQIHATGTVSDILGSFQLERFELLLASDEDLKIVEQTLDELAKSSVPDEVLPENTDNELLTLMRQVLPSIPEIPELAEFVQNAVRLAGGSFAMSVQGTSSSVKTPFEWLALDSSLKEDYECLYLEPPNDPNISPDDILHPSHPLIRAAILWFHQLRFQPGREEIRLAYQIGPDISEPEMLVLFLISLRDETGSVVTVFEPVYVTSTSISTDTEGDRQRFTMAIGKSGGNVPVAILEKLFSGWWDGGQQKAFEQAKQRADNYRRTLMFDRQGQKRRFENEWKPWKQATEQHILGDYKGVYQQLTLFRDFGDRIPPSILKRLQQHQEKADQLLESWERWATLLPPTVEEVGILLRVPEGEVG